MAIYKCKMCGGDLNIGSDAVVVECDYCGTTQTVPTADNEKKLNLFNRANRLRLNSEFDKAAGIYESIIAEFPEEAEAYWGLCLCNYGIEYVDAPATGNKVPTCHRASFEKLASDENFGMAMEYADVVAQKVYRDEAREIDRIMEEILSVSKNEKPYDVFICYKETDDKGERTIDSVLAQDVYDALAAKGLKVFFARISLEDKLGKMYEPYIFAALNSAKVMLAIGTKYEHFHAVWVKNEWSRFLKIMAKDKSKALIPCYKDMDAYDMPDEFKALQAQDMGKIGFMQDLVRGVEKIIKSEKPQTKVVKETATIVQSNANTDALLERAFMFLEDGDWKSADEYCEKVLDLEPKNAQAYLGKLMAELKVREISDLEKCSESFENNGNYQKVIRFADSELKEKLKSYLNKINTYYETVVLHEKYKEAMATMKKAKTSDEYKFVAEQFVALGKYKDSAAFADMCLKKYNQAIETEALECKSVYDKAIETAEHYKNDFFAIKVKRLMIEDSIDKLESIHFYKDSKNKANEYRDYLKKLDRTQEKSGCYVATAVYGSYDCPQVWTLRRYRDNVLAKTWYGKVFIYTYYAISPNLVKWFGHTGCFKKLWKNRLDNMVSSLNANGFADTPYEDKKW